MMSLLPFRALNIVVLLSMQGQKLRFLKKKSKCLCSEDEGRFCEFGTTTLNCLYLVFCQIPADYNSLFCSSQIILHLK